ncbi:hypothetical protein COOONC_23143 [Cooperia oncophora]
MPFQLLRVEVYDSALESWESYLKKVSRQKWLGKSPGRAARTRKISTTSSEASSSAPKTPTRRTPTRSVTKSKAADVEPETSKRKSTVSKAVKALNEKFTLPKPLGGIDAGTLFDMTMKGTSSRRRTMSDSEIPAVNAKRSKTLKVVDAIAEEEDELGSALRREQTSLPAKRRADLALTRRVTTAYQEMSAHQNVRRHALSSRSQDLEVQEGSKRKTLLPKAAKLLGGSVTSRSSGDRGDHNVEEVFATEGRRSSSRQRRPASATPAEPSPSRTRTRKGSGISLCLH